MQPTGLPPRSVLLQVGSDVSAFQLISLSAAFLLCVHDRVLQRLCRSTCCSPSHPPSILSRVGHVSALLCSDSRRSRDLPDLPASLSRVQLVPALTPDRRGAHSLTQCVYVCSDWVRLLAIRLLCSALKPGVCGATATMLSELPSVTPQESAAAADLVS